MNINVEELRAKIMPVIKKQKLKKVVLFGSRARGNAKQNSDYDFYIDAPEIQSMFKLSELFTDMKSCLQSEVDIVLTPDKYTKIQDYLMQAIQKDGVVIYE